MTTHYPCDCDTKRSEPEFHAETCKHRMHLELNALRAKLSEVEADCASKISACEEIVEECGRLRDDRDRLAAELSNIKKEQDKLKTIISQAIEFANIPAGNRRLMQVAGPFRELINILKQAK